MASWLLDRLLAAEPGGNGKGHVRRFPLIWEPGGTVAAVPT
jgi:hypothetical protein